MWFAAWVKMLGPQTRMARHCKRSIPLVSHIMLHYLYTYHVAEAWKLARRHARSFQFAQAIRFCFLIQLCTLKVKVASTPAVIVMHAPWWVENMGQHVLCEGLRTGPFLPEQGWLSQSAAGELYHLSICLARTFRDTNPYNPITLAFGSRLQ